MRRPAWPSSMVRSTIRLFRRWAAWPVAGRRDSRLPGLADGIVLVDAAVPALETGLRSFGEIVPAFGGLRETRPTTDVLTSAMNCPISLMLLGRVCCETFLIPATPLLNRARATCRSGACLTAVWWFWLTPVDEPWTFPATPRLWPSRVWFVQASEHHRNTSVLVTHLHLLA